MHRTFGANCSDVWLPSVCPHPPSLPPSADTANMAAGPRFAAKYRRLIIQDQRLGSASRLSLCCVVRPTETLLRSFLSFNLCCPSFALPPHGCLPLSVQNLPLSPVSFVLSPLCCSFLPAQSSPLNPPLLGHFLSIFLISPAHF